MSTAVKISIQIIKSSIHKTTSLCEPYQYDNKQKSSLVFACGSYFADELEIGDRKQLILNTFQ
jgi:hypothetical protein